MGYYQFFNPNPRHQNPVGDCVIRALSKALNIPWESAYLDMAMEGYDRGDMPSSNAILDAYLRSKGFRKYAIPNDSPTCYTFADFAGEHFKGTYVVCTGSHVACISQGLIWDSWDSSDCCPLYYYERRS